MVSRVSDLQIQPPDQHNAIPRCARDLLSAWNTVRRRLPAGLTGPPSCPANANQNTTQHPHLRLPRQPISPPSALLPSTTTRTTGPLPPPAGPAALPCARLGPLGHELREAEVAPRGLAAQRRGLLDAEGGVLVGHDVVLVLRVHGLVVRGHVDVVGREPVLGEGLEEVGVARAVQVERGEVGVFVLGRGQELVLVGSEGREGSGLDLGPGGEVGLYCLGMVGWNSEGVVV